MKLLVRNFTKVVLSFTKSGTENYNVGTVMTNNGTKITKSLFWICNQFYIMIHYAIQRWIPYHCFSCSLGPLAYLASLVGVSSSKSGKVYVKIFTYTPAQTRTPLHRTLQLVEEIPYHRCDAAEWNAQQSTNVENSIPVQCVSHTMRCAAFDQCGKFHPNAICIPCHAMRSTQSILKLPSKCNLYPMQCDAQHSIHLEMFHPNAVTAMQNTDPVDTIEFVRMQSHAMRMLREFAKRTSRICFGMAICRRGLSDCGGFLY